MRHLDRMNTRLEVSVTEWFPRFWTSFFFRRPVDATFIGHHEHDHALPDWSPEGVAAACSEMQDLLASAPDREGHDPLQALDQRVAEGFLRVQIRECETRHLLDNPSIHVGEAVFGLMSPLLPNRPPTRAAMEAMEARLGAVPEFLAQAEEATEGAPDAWILRAVRECRGGLSFLRVGLGHLGHDFGGSRRVAEEALVRFQGVLKSRLKGHRSEPPRPVACGPDMLDLYIRQGHFLEQSTTEIAAYARAELQESLAWLDQHAVDFGAATPAEALAGLAGRHPDADGYYARFGEIWSDMRDRALEKDLVTWPHAPIEYVPRPEWSRAAAPDLYFLFYRSPSAFQTPSVHHYLVAPLASEASDGDLETFLRANNDSVIKLNHVVHHGGLGHHVQNWHARRSPLSVGRVAAVDGASRIAMFCGGTMAEGWACYATDLMAEVGALTPLEAYGERHGRARMCARAIVDVELHLGNMDLAAAAAFYQENAGMSPQAASSEAVKNSMFPGAALMYLIGMDLIRDLRRELVPTIPGNTPLRDFHDAFLSYGSIPVALVAAEMRRRAEAGLGLGAHDPTTSSNRA